MHPLLESRSARYLLVLTSLVSACTGNASPGSSSRAPAESLPTEEGIPSQVELVLSIKGDPHPLNGPTDLDVDPEGNIYVVDSLNVRVQVLNSTGAFLRMWGSAGGEFGQFKFMAAEGGEGFGSIVVSAQGSVFVADEDRIQRFDPNGRFITSWSEIDSEGTQFFTDAWGVAVDRQGNVYVVDDHRSEIFVFNSEGEVLDRWGERGEGDGQMQIPGFIFIDPDKRLYVADWDNHRIQKFDDQGLFISKWGTLGTGDGEFNHPSDVAVDALGNVYVADTGNLRIQVFDQEGQFLYKWGSRGSGDYEFNDPRAVVVDGAGRIYVADYYNDRVQVFQKR